jgi:hypothetical protein
MWIPDSDARVVVGDETSAGARGLVECEWVGVCLDVTLPLRTPRTTKTAGYNRLRCFLGLSVGCPLCVAYLEPVEGDPGGVASLNQDDSGVGEDEVASFEGGEEGAIKRHCWAPSR